MKNHTFIRQQLRHTHRQHIVRQRNTVPRGRRPCVFGADAHRNRRRFLTTDRRPVVGVHQRRRAKGNLAPMEGKHAQAIVFAWSIDQAHIERRIVLKTANARFRAIGVRRIFGDKCQLGVNTPFNTAKQGGVASEKLMRCGDTIHRIAIRWPI